MPFTSTTFNSGGAPGIDSGVLNTMQTQYTEAVNSFNQDFLSAFVLSGFTAAKDGTTASQLDVASGVAYLLQTDGTTRRRSANALTYSTVGHASTTMYLDLNPDGTWSWNTAHSAVANYLPICSVTTDASANIATVTDARNLKTTMLWNAGSIIFQSILGFNRTLSSSNQLMDWQQNFGVYSDNTASIFTGATNRLWFSATGTNGTQEMHFGPRAGSNTLAGARFMTANFWLDGTGAPTVGTFKVQGGITTSLDAGAITTDGSGNLTASTFVGALKDSAGAASAINAHDTGTTMQFKPTAANRGLLFSSRDSGGVLHNGMTIDTSGNTTLSGTLSTDSGNITTDGTGIINAKEFRVTGGLRAYHNATYFTEVYVPQTAGDSTHNWGHIFQTVGTDNAVHNTFSIGAQLAGALSWADVSGNHNANAYYLTGAGGTGQMSLDTSGHFLNFWAPNPAGTGYSIDFHPWTGSANPAALHLDTNSIAWLGTSRNGASTLVPIYTGTTSPTSPPTGAIWIDA